MLNVVQKIPLLSVKDNSGKMKVKIAFANINILKYYLIIKLTVLGVTKNVLNALVLPIIVPNVY